MGGHLHDFLLFGRRDRRKTLLLLLLLLLVGIGFHYLPRLLSGNEAEEQQLMEVARQEHEAFEARLQAQAEADRVQEELFPFDPNWADSLTLHRLGLPPWMVRNVLRYRSKGGRFRRPDDFSKLYGLTDEQYARLQPYIRIAAPPEQASSAAELPSDTVPMLYRPDTTARYPARPEKYPAGTLVQLNEADTAELQRIPGIGPFLARRIVSYRQQLGGYYGIDQLREIDIDSRPLHDWLQVDTTRIRRLYINRETLNGFMRHPYLRYHQARAIMDYRRRHGPIRHLQELSLLEEFTPADLERLSHYVSLDTENL